MSTFKFANNVQTTLAAPITTVGQTSITLSSAANLPTLSGGQVMVLTLNDAASQAVFEIVYVTAIVGAVLTVIRGQEGTVANTWLANDNAYASDTAAILNSFALVNSTNAFTAGPIVAYPAAIGSIPMIASGVAGQTANIQNWTQTLNGTPVTFVDKNGILNFAASTGAFLPNGASIAAGATGNMLLNTTSGQGFLFTSGAVGITPVASIANGGFIMMGSTAFVGTSGNGFYQAGTSGSATKFADVFNGIGSGHFTRLGTMGDTVQTIVGTVFEIAESSANQLLTLDGSGNLGINGTLHQASKRELKQRIEYIDPKKALAVVLATKIARYDFVDEDSAEDNHTRHASFIAEDTPWELSGGPGQEHADPQKTASYALAAIAALHSRIATLEGKRPAS